MRAPAAPGRPFVGTDFPEPAYQQLCRLLRQQQGFDLGGYKDLCIKRRIAARVRSVGLHQAEAYLDLLRSDPTEQQHLMAALTIHVSQFFRNPSTYAVLENRVLPELMAKAAEKNRQLRIWSIGCAGGEEPYSLALLCRRLRIAEDQVSIIATDLSRTVLEQAKRAVYQPQRLAQVPEEVVERYFDRQGGHYRLNPEVRQQVQFFQQDILRQQPFCRADLILCRNLLIYFSRDQQRRILQALATVLPRGGYLVLGRAETLAVDSRQWFRCVDPAERVYQRRAPAEETWTEVAAYEAGENGGRIT